MTDRPSRVHATMFLLNPFGNRTATSSFIRFLGLFSFSVFLVSGALKPEGTLISNLPLNITILTMAMSGIIGLIWFLSHMASVKFLSMMLVIVLFVTFFPGVILAPSIPVASSKIMGIFTGTLIASICLTILLDDERHVPLYLKITHFVALIGIFNFFTGGITTILLLQGGSEIDRKAMFGVSPIDFGRLAGLLFLVSCLFIVNKIKTKTITIYWYLMGIIGLLAGILSASRGPVFASIIVIIFYTMLTCDLKSINLKTILFFTCGIFMIILLIYHLIPESSYERIAGGILSGRSDDSIDSRAIGYAKSIYIILRHPIGIGWAGFVTWVDLFDGLPYQHPHNILIEIFLEGGWVPGITFIFLLGFSFIKIIKNRSNQLYNSLACLYFYHLINAMVSSDIVGNRAVFAFLFLIIGLPLKNKTNILYIEEPS